MSFLGILSTAFETSLIGLQLSGLTGHEPRGPASRYLPSAEITGMCRHASIFTWVLGAKRGPLYLQVLYQFSLPFSPPGLWFLNKSVVSQMCVPASLSHRPWHHLQGTAFGLQRLRQS